jgi:hypothetical protein
MLRSHYLVDADPMGFRCVFWPNWELCADDRQIFWRFLASVGRRNFFYGVLVAFIGSASFLYRLVYRFLIFLCPADIDRLNTDYRGFCKVPFLADA